jgi:hypothetical protein
MFKLRVGIMFMLRAGFGVLSDVPVPASLSFELDINRPLSGNTAIVNAVRKLWAT